MRPDRRGELEEDELRVQGVQGQVGRLAGEIFIEVLLFLVFFFWHVFVCQAAFFLIVRQPALNRGGVRMLWYICGRCFLPGDGKYSPPNHSRIREVQILSTNCYLAFSTGYYVRVRCRLLI